METQNLIDSVKMLMFQTGYIDHGKKMELAKAARCHPVQLSYALNGTRKTKRSKEILVAIQSFLRKKL